MVTCHSYIRDGQGECLSIDLLLDNQSVANSQTTDINVPRKNCSHIQTRTCKGRLLIFVEYEVDRLSWLGHDIDLHLGTLGHLAFNSRVCLQDADSGVSHFGQGKLLTCYIELAGVFPVRTGQQELTNTNAWSTVEWNVCFLDQ